MDKDLSEEMPSLVNVAAIESMQRSRVNSSVERVVLQDSLNHDSSLARQIGRASLVESKVQSLFDEQRSSSYTELPDGAI